MPAAKPSFPTLNRSHPLASGLVFGAPMYEGSGLRLNDVSGSGGVGTFNANMVWAGGRSGSAIKGNGTNSDVSIAGAPACGPAMSVACSVFSSAFTSSMMLAERANVNATWELFFELSSLNWRGASGTNRLAVAIATAGISNGNWYDILLTDTGLLSGVGASLYVNGVLVGTGNAGSLPTSNTNAIHLGDYDNTGFFLNGLMDYAYVWNRTLSAADAKALYADPFQMYRRRRAMLKAAAVASGLLLKRRRRLCA